MRTFYGDRPDQFVEVSASSESASRGTIALVHGGYWRQQYDLHLQDPLADHLAARGWDVVNIEYRRIDDRPGIWNDMAADIVSGLGLAEARPLLAVGHSAGGHLALWAGAQRNLIDAVVALAPVADLRLADDLGLSNNATRELIGGSAEEFPQLYDRASPIELLPLGIPQLVVHGDADEAVPQSMSVEYADAAREAGDEIRLLTPAGVDHMDLIDPADDVWRVIENQLDAWSAELG